MQGYVGFGMIIRLEGGNSGSHKKTAERVYEELERNFVMALPMIIREGVMVWQLIVKSLFELDPAMKKIESLNGVKGADVFTPHPSRADLYQDWAQREINSRLHHIKGGPLI